MESMSGMGPFLSLPTGKSILGKAIVGPPVAATALGAQIYNTTTPLHDFVAQLLCTNSVGIRREKLYRILLVDPNHGALHGFPIQLPVVVDLHCPEVDFRDLFSGHRFPPGGVCFVDEGDFSVSWVHQLRPSESSNVAKELKDVFLRTTTTVWWESATNLAHLGDRGLEILNDNLGALKRGNTSAIAIEPEVWGLV